MSDLTSMLREQRSELIALQQNFRTYCNDGNVPVLTSIARPFLRQKPPGSTTQSVLGHIGAVPTSVAAHIHELAPRSALLDTLGIAVSMLRCSGGIVTAEEADAVRAVRLAVVGEGDDGSATATTPEDLARAEIATAAACRSIESQSEIIRRITLEIIPRVVAGATSECYIAPLTPNAPPAVRGVLDNASECVARGQFELTLALSDGAYPIAALHITRTAKRLSDAEVNAVVTVIAPYAVGALLRAETAARDALRAASHVRLHTASMGVYSALGTLEGFATAAVGGARGVLSDDDVRVGGGLLARDLHGVVRVYGGGMSPTLTIPHAATETDDGTGVIIPLGNNHDAALWLEGVGLHSLGALRPYLAVVQEAYGALAASQQRQELATRDALLAECVRHVFTKIPPQLTVQSVGNEVCAAALKLVGGVGSVALHMVQHDGTEERIEYNGNDSCSVLKRSPKGLGRVGDVFTLRCVVNDGKWIGIPMGPDAVVTIDGAATLLTTHLAAFGDTLGALLTSAAATERAAWELACAAELLAMRRPALPPAASVSEAKVEAVTNYALTPAMTSLLTSHAFDMKPLNDDAVAAVLTALCHRHMVAVIPSTTTRSMAALVLAAQDLFHQSDDFRVAVSRAQFASLFATACGGTLIPPDHAVACILAALLLKTSPMSAITAAHTAATFLRKAHACLAPMGADDRHALQQRVVDYIMSSGLHTSLKRLETMTTARMVVAAAGVSTLARPLTPAPREKNDALEHIDGFGAVCLSEVCDAFPEFGSRWLTALASNRELWSMA